MTIFEEFQKLASDHYQRCERPRPSIPATIEVCYDTETGGAMIVFSFKDTTLREGEMFVRRYLKQKNLPYDFLRKFQDGEYEDDWIVVQAIKKE